jgi:hypothetical protein
MLGWMILFALLSLAGLISLALGATVVVTMTATSVIFAALFCACIITRLIRHQA